MGVAKIEIVNAVYEAMALPERGRVVALKRELAGSLYARCVLSFGKARRLADLIKREFHRLLGNRAVECHYTEAMLDVDGGVGRKLDDVETAAVASTPTD